MGVGRGLGVLAGLERVKQDFSSSCYIVNRSVERLLIGPRGSIKAADLTHELKRCIVQLLFARGVFGVSQPLDVPAHVGAFRWW